MALQSVMGLIGICGFGALVAIQRAGQFLAFDPRLASPVVYYVVYYGFVPMVLCLMGWL